MDGSESDMATRARKFAGRLHGRFGCRVEFMDERLSSAEAKMNRAALAEAGASAAAEETVDAEAAALILQSWLQQASDS